MKRCRIFVSGRVQGVAFRYYTQRRADELGIVGWVRNLGDGRVEILAQGPEHQVDKLITWSHHGPTFARVEEVVIHEENKTENFTGFQVLR